MRLVRLDFGNIGKNYPILIDGKIKNSNIILYLGLFFSVLFKCNIFFYYNPGSI